MFYTIYQITNLIDGKIYIGKHQTKDLDDGYMGSGKILKRSIAKHGIENFKKDILFQFDNEGDMNSKEAQLVTEEFCLREDTYNLCVGGKGGFSYIRTLDSYSEQVKLGRRRADCTIQSKYGVKNYSQTDESKAANSIRIKYLHSINAIPKATFLGKKHSDETKAKIGEANSKMTGSKNSQFGTMWITNGQENKKIKKDVDIIPEGWYKGRK